MNVKKININQSEQIYGIVSETAEEVIATEIKKRPIIYEAIGYNNNGYGLQIELVEENLVTVTLFKKENQYIWYKNGYVQVQYADDSDIVLTFTPEYNVLYYIYYSKNTTGLSYTSDYSSIPEYSVLLEALWINGINKIYVSFTIGQNKRVGFNETLLDRFSCSNISIAELAKIKKQKTIYETIGYNISGDGLQIELGEEKLVTVTLFKKKDQNIWWKNGYVRIIYPDDSDIVLTFTATVYVLYYIYYNNVDGLSYTSDYSSIPEYSVLLEAFWLSITNGRGFISFTVAQNKHVGFDETLLGRFSCSNISLAQLAKIEENAAKIKEINTKPFPYSGKIFLQVGCIGDSYTAGYQFSEGVAVSSNPEYSWTHYISKITGNNWINFAKSGSSVKSWVTEENPKYTNMEEVRNKKCQAYIIGLGLNDASSTMPTRVELGTADDIGTDADSYYAYYYKLIQELLVINPKSIVFCNTGPHVNSGYNQAVRDVVNYCKNNNQQVWLCDLAGNYMNEDYYLHPVFLSDRVDGHYTAIGYEFMAECYIKVISDVINANASSFREVETIPFDV